MSATAKPPQSQSSVAHFYRPPETVMRLQRMGSAHQGRLSFMRSLLRRLKREQWQFSCTAWEINEQGIGYAVYSACGPERTYSLVAFAHDLPDELRNDRVIATAWDATFTLFDGLPTHDDIARLAANVPKQEAGRISQREICLSRANRSVRLFNSVLNHLATGQQPSQAELESVGYLMRTTAVYGSGKFGAADRDKLLDRPELAGAFQAEMLTVWLIRSFTLDLVEHLAAVHGGEQAVKLEPHLRRCIGVGNSTGLGMAPFLMNHPVLLNNWMMAREEALARVRAQEAVPSAIQEQFQHYLQRAVINADYWQSQHPLQQTKLQQLRQDLATLQTWLAAFDFQQAYPWDALYRQAEQHLSLEGQEQLAMLLLEPYGDLVDGLTDCMTADERELRLINGRQSLGELSEQLHQYYHWALQINYSEPENRSRFWYVSEEKLEPRLGERFEEPGTELEQPLCIGWHVKRFYQALKTWPADTPLAEFLLQHPEHRHIARRVQTGTQHPYMDIQDNLISADLLPINLLRLKLSFFGATRFDPRSDRWVRITMFQHAPFPYELADMSADDWVYPPLPEQA